MQRIVAEDATYYIQLSSQGKQVCLREVEHTKADFSILYKTKIVQQLQRINVKLYNVAHRYLQVASTFLL